MNIEHFVKALRTNDTEIDIDFPSPTAKCGYPVHSRTKDGHPVILPCGQCEICLSRKVSKLSSNFALALYGRHFSLITLTYSDDYLPKSPRNMDTLSKEHLRSFIKSFRKRYARPGYPQIRYVAAGEYGSKNARPHYHIVISGGATPTHSHVLKNELSDIWKYGFVDIRSNRRVSAAYGSVYYTLKYVTKNRSHVGTTWLDDRLPEFYITSRDNTPYSFFSDLSTQFNERSELIMPLGLTLAERFVIDTHLAPGKTTLSEYTLQSSSVHVLGKKYTLRKPLVHIPSKKLSKKLQVFPITLNRTNQKHLFFEQFPTIKDAILSRYGSLTAFYEYCSELKDSRLDALQADRYDEYTDYTLALDAQYNRYAESYKVVVDSEIKFMESQMCE